MKPVTDKREHIMQVAEDLFSEKGFEGTSIRTLAQKAGVNVAMVSYYFGSKEKLFEALVEHRSMFMRQHMENLNADKTMNAWQKMELLIAAFVERMHEKKRFHKIMHHELTLSKHKVMQLAVANVLSKNAEQFRKLITEGKKEKVFHEDVEAKFVIATVLGTLHQVNNNPLLCSKPFSASSNEEENKKLLKQYLITMLKGYLLKKKLK